MKVELDDVEDLATAQILLQIGSMTADVYTRIEDAEIKAAAKKVLLKTLQLFEAIEALEVPTE